MSRAQLTSTVEQNTGGAVSPYVAGKNRIINGAMDWWQRGTTASPGAATGYFAADRWYTTPTAAAYTLAQETSNVPLGFQYALKTTAVSGTGVWFLQFIESQNCQDLAGKTVTLSAYCSTSASQSVDLVVYYNTTFGAVSGTSGWTAVSTTTVSTTAAMPTTPQSGQFAIPSTAKALYVLIKSTGNLSSSATMTFTGVQLEIGSVATPFSRAGGTLSGELEACLRYYERRTAQGANYGFGLVGRFGNSTSGTLGVTFAVPKRTNPSIAFSSMSVYNGGTGLTVNSINGPYGSGQSNGVIAADVGFQVSSGGTAGFAATAEDGGGGTGYIEFSAEL